VAAKLYVILGSHACRTGMLLLDHKGIAYEVVELPTGLHPLAMRVLGFGGNAAPFRELGDRRGRMVGVLDRLGTVPALRMNGDRVKTNRDIARHLDRLQPDPPLFPADPDARREVEEAEAWGDDVFQMAARRLTAAASMHGPGALHNDGGDGRLGPLLWRNARVRSAGVGMVRRTFGADERGEAALRAQLPAMLDRIDGWIAAGVLNGEALTAADYMLASSLALLTYVTDLRDEIAGRPARALVDRLLPEPE
jgi:glutathione S-transferase